MECSTFGKTAAVVSVLTATNPVEIIKLRLQTAQQLLTTGRVKQNYSSIRHVISSMVEQQGVRSLWKGNTIGILRFLPNQYINYQVRQSLQKIVPNISGINIAKAVLAGWVSSSILYPLDILRQTLGTNTQKETKVFKTVKGIFKNHGPRYFYKGYANSLLGTAAFRASFNGLYDSTKTKATSANQKSLIAYTCAVVAGAINYPIDIIRKRRILLNSNQSLLSFGSKIWKQEGIKGFYKGSKLIPLQSITGAVILLIFDTNKNQIQ